MRTFRCLLNALVLSLALVACQKGPSGENRGGGASAHFPHAISAPTEYYTNGPQQARPPDGRFPAGLKVVVLNEAGSYVRVRSETGIEAYVSAGALRTLR